MIDLIVVALLQAVAGPPAPASPEPGAVAEQPAGQTTEEPSEPQAEATPEPTAATPPAETQYREERVCVRLDVATGERMPRRRCSTVRVPITEGEEQTPAPQ